MEGLLEYKGTIADVKDVDIKSRVVTGYLASFGNIDSYGDMIVKGAFEKTLRERKSEVFFLNNHDWKQPHGKFAELKEDQKGLYFESKALPDTTYSNDVLKLYEAGIMKGHSFGYKTISFEKKSHGRRLKELQLYEGSNTINPVNSDTPFMGFKSELREINDQSKILYKAIRGGNFTDDTFQLLEVALKQLQLKAFNLGKQALNEPFTDTHNSKSLSIIKQFTNDLNI